MSRSGAVARPGRVLGVAVPLAAVALVASAVLGFVLGTEHAARDEQAAAAAASGSVTAWVRSSVDRGVEQVTAAMADRQLRRRGPAVLGASASLGGVPFRSLHLQLAGSATPTVAQARAGGFRTQAIVEYRLPVEDVRVGRRAEAVFRLHRGTWRLVRVAPSGLDLWDHEPVQAVRSGKVLALGANGDHRVVDLAATAERARRTVDAFWRERWPGTVVVVLPSTARLLDPLLGSRTGSDQVAVTRWETGSDGPVIRVLVNPTFYDSMSQRARSIVLRHEITHVAQDALPHGAIPSWLTEGLADYVGYRTSGVQADVIMSELLERVRTEGAPSHLPSDAAFGFSRSQEQRRTAYQAGWAFCQMVADRYGDARLVSFYAAVAKATTADPEHLDDAAQRVLGTSFDVLVDQWRSWLDAHA